MNTTEKANKISLECLQSSGDTPRCIDDRDLRSDIDLATFPDFAVTKEQFNGPQFLGGSLGVVALVAESMVAQNPDQELDFDAVFTKTLELHQSAGLKLGVHMDDHHGHMTGEEVVTTLGKIEGGQLGQESVIPGCGFAGLLANAENPLGLSPKVSEFFRNNPNIVDELVRRGAKLSILTGNHAPKESAMAVENLTPGMTVATGKAIDQGTQTYGHDTGTLGKLLEPMGDGSPILMKKNKVWLDVTTNILAGMDPAQLPAQ